MPNKKGKRLVDVLDEEFDKDRDVLVKSFTEKFLKLWGIVLNNRSASEKDKTWCSDMIDTIGKGTIPTRDELLHANSLWKIYK